MYNSFEKQGAKRKPASIEYIVATLREILPEIAKELIASSYTMANPLDQNFLDQPDNPAEHSPMWHQYGIVTHSEKFRQFIEVDVPKLMEEWGLSNKTEMVLSEKIDGISKGDLLQVVALVHDLGKFTARTFEHTQDGSTLARFVDHEAHSGAIIRTKIKNTLQQIGLSEAQIEYIAECAKHHFDLGKARNVAVNTVGYTMKFATSPTFKLVAKDIIDACPERALEIGLMFIADSLGKTEIAATATTDKGIEAQRTGLEQEIKDKGLNPLLINQALQQPVNIEIGKQYLHVWAS